MFISFPLYSRTMSSMLPGLSLSMSICLTSTLISKRNDITLLWNRQLPANILQWAVNPEHRLDIKTIFPRFGDSHIKDTSYLLHGDQSTDNMTSLYWDISKIFRSKANWSLVSSHHQFNHVFQVTIGNSCFIHRKSISMSNCSEIFPSIVNRDFQLISVVRCIQEVWSK